MRARPRMESRLKERTGPAEGEKRLAGTRAAPRLAPPGVQWGFKGWQLPSMPGFGCRTCDRKGKLQRKEGKGGLFRDPHTDLVTGNTEVQSSRRQNPGATP